MFKVVAAYFDDKDIKWEKLVGVCTDGDPVMVASRSGFITRIKQNNSSAVCGIYLEALATKTPSAAIKDKFVITIQVGNFVKASDVNTRLSAKLRKEMDSTHEVLLFYTSVHWYRKVIL